MTVRFGDEALAAAPPEEVWKLLYDPARLGDWWVDVGAVADVEARRGATRFTMFTPGDEPVALQQLLQGDHEQGRIVISCLTHGVRYRWRLEEAGGATRVSVAVEVPREQDAHAPRLRRSTAESLARLIALAEREAR